MVPLAANSVMVSPGLPVPLMAGLGLLVMASPMVPVSLGVPGVRPAVATAGAVVSSLTTTASAAPTLPAGSVALMLKAFRPSLK